MRTAILVQDSTFINIEPIVSRLVPAVNNNSQMTMIDGCGSRWCSYAVFSVNAGSGMRPAGCAPRLSTEAMVNLSSPLPVWLSVMECLNSASSSATVTSQNVSHSKTLRRTATHLTSSTSLSVRQPPTPLSSALLAASRGITAIVTVTYIISRATSGAALPFAQVSLRSLTLARLCDNNNNHDNDDSDDPFLSGPMDNPLQLHITGSGIPREAKFVAGSVVGNVVFCVICSAIGVAVIAIARHRQTQQRALARQGMKAHDNGGAAPPSFSNTLFECLSYFPSSLVFPYGALSQPLATASVALFVVVGNYDIAGGTVGVVFLAVFDLFICVVLPIYWVGVVHFNWFCKASSFDEGENNSTTSSEIERPAVRFVRRGEVDWAPFLERLLLRLHTIMLYPHAFNGWEPHPQHVSSSARDRYRRPIAVEAYLPLMEAL